MRNLKKVLSLALALVMLIGMMVVGAGAVVTDFRDDADINADNKEAVLVMNALGILEGYDDGSFGAEGTLNRAEAAKILAYVHAGATVADALGQTQTKFTDVPANEWYSGYVAYCANMDIIAGSSATTFDPKGNLTAMQFAKMLLVAMGGDSTKYVGDAWATNTMRDAVTAGLNEKARVTDWNAPITRDQASQMAFNGMTKTLDGGKMVYPVVKDGKTVGTFDTSIEAILYANALGSDYTTGEPYRDTTGTLGEKNYDLKQEATADAFGRATKTWKAKGDVKVVIDSISAAAKTYTNAVNSGTVAKDFDGYTVDVKKGNYITNGAAETGTATDASTIKTFANIESLIANGKIVEVYTTNKVIDKVIVLEKKVATLTADPVVKDGKVTITAAGIVGAKVEDVDGYDTVAKGDVVLYASNGKGQFMIEPAEMITASITGYTNGTFGTSYNSAKALIDGELYGKSALYGTNYTQINDTKTYDIWLDNGGNIVATAVAGTGETQTAQLAVVQELAWVTPTTDNSIGSSAKPYVQARLVFLDGTSEIVTVGSIDGVKFVKADSSKDIDKVLNITDKKVASANSLSDAKNLTKSDLSTVTGNDKGTAKVYWAVEGSTSGEIGDTYYLVSSADDLYDSNAGAFTKGMFYNYTESDGTYKLTSLDSSKQGSNTKLDTNKKITNNKPLFNDVRASGVANANTVFIYGTKGSNGSYTFTSYTGIAEVPGTAEYVTGGYSIVINGIATYVYADLGDKGTANTSTDKVFITNKNFVTVNGNPKYIQATVLVNGEEDTVRLKDGGTYEPGTLYNVVSVDGNDIMTLSAVTTTRFTGIKSVTGNVLAVGNNTKNGAYTCTDDTVAYVLDGTTVDTTTVSALALDGNDVVTVVTNATGSAAEAVYVQKVSQGPEAVTVAVATTSSLGASGDLTDGTITVTGYSSSKKNIKLTITVASGTKVKSVALNGTEITGVTSWTTGKDNLEVNKGTNSIVVIIEDNNGGPDASFSYTLTAKE